MVYPGNPQGCSPDETGARGVYLVEVDDDGTPHLEFRPVDVVRWESLEVDITGLETEQELLNAMDAAASSCAKDAGGRPLVIRLTLTGRGTLHRELRREGITAELLERLNLQYAAGRPWLWCERIQLETRSMVDPRRWEQREDFVGGLARLVENVLSDPEALDELRRPLRELYDAPRARRYLGELLPQGEELRRTVSAAAEECITELAEDEDAT